MDTEEIIKRLRNPRKYNTSQPAQPAVQTPQPETWTPVQPAPQKHKTENIVAAVIGVLFLITLVFWMMSKSRAENLTAALDPTQVQGLSQQDETFNPNTGVTYIEVQEGQDRNVAVSNLGSTLPIISRFNYKTMTEKNFEIIGAAPWALTTNFASNLNDPPLMAYLLGNEKMIQAFLTRPDVAPLLEDPQMLQAFCEDQKTLNDFFADNTVQAVLANPQMVRTLAGSRFMGYLLISKSLKYFRNHPQEAVQIINQNPHLAALRQNEGVVTAVKENPYLKSIADTLLALPQAQSQAAPAPKAATTSTAKKKTSTAKKRRAKK